MITRKSFLSIAAFVVAANLTGGSKAVADQVIPDDLIVQGSLCVGFDCVNNESFGFDTIKLKENNLRIKFENTSVGAFPTNDWQLTANDSASGGASKFSIEDVTGAKVPFTVIAGAPSNSMFVASNGKVGFRTASPVLDVHVTTSDTPAHRLEQNNAGGFTAQTWDIAGNEANFFVRDVTGGSRLPFRIRPGAPTSSLDIAANGSVGIGTASPQGTLDVRGNANGTVRSFLYNTSTGASRRQDIAIGTGATLNAEALFLGVNQAGAFGLGAAIKSYLDNRSGGSFVIANNGANAVTIDTTGNMGVGTTTPAARLHTTGSVRFAGLPNCGSGILSDGNGTLACIGSSRQIKNIAGDLPSDVALANIMALRPQIGSYKTTPDVPEHWFIAEDVAAVDQALVGLNDGKPHVVKTQNVVADLVAVVQQQQREIQELKRLLSSK